MTPPVEIVLGCSADDPSMPTDCYTLRAVFRAAEGLRDTKDVDRSYDGVKVGCFNRREADYIRGALAERYPDVADRFMFTWNEWRSQTCSAPA